MSQTLQKLDLGFPARALSIATFEAQLGGRDALFDVLSQADSTPEIQQLLALLGDPGLHRQSLAHLCRLANLTAGDVFLAFERALQVRAKVLARIPIAEKLPYVAADAMKKALLHQVNCPECYGRGRVERKVKKGDQETYEIVACYPCDGSGKVSVEPDLDQQKLALELGELCQKGGLTISNQNIQESKSVTFSLGSTLAQLQARTAEAAFSIEATAPDPPVVDA